MERVLERTEHGSGSALEPSLVPLLENRVIRCYLTHKNSPLSHTMYSHISYHCYNKSDSFPTVRSLYWRRRFLCKVGAEFYVTKSASLFAEVHRNTTEASCNTLHWSVARHANCCHQPRLNLAQFRDWIADITSSWCTTDTGQLYSDHLSLLQHICKPLAFHGTWRDRGTLLDILCLLLRSKIKS